MPTKYARNFVNVILCLSNLVFSKNLIRLCTQNMEKPNQAWKNRRIQNIQNILRDASNI